MESLESFETHRRYLFAIAYRMLGSVMDAEDMVQETYLRYQKTPPETVASPKALLTTILVRLCMDQLHLARKQREIYPGPWLPEPILTDDLAESADPEQRIAIEESLSLAFLTLLEELQPVERAVFLLHEVFDYDYAEIAAFLGRSEVACRQSFSRAKKHLAEHRPRFPVAPDIHRQLLSGFLRAVQAGDMTALMQELAEDVTLWADGGGKIKGAATRPIVGSLHVARFVLATEKIAPPQFTIDLGEINGEPALLMRTPAGVYLTITIEVVAQRIQTVRIVGNPDKLAPLNAQIGAQRDG